MKIKKNHEAKVPETSTEKLKENLEKKIQKQNVYENLNNNSDILNNIMSQHFIKIVFPNLHEKIKLKLIK